MAITFNYFFLSDHQMRAAEPLCRYTHKILTNKILLLFYFIAWEFDFLSWTENTNKF
jgi:hypothetical protein